MNEIRNPQSTIRNPLIWAWTGIDKGRSNSELAAKYRTLKAHGLHGVFLGGGIDDREFEAVKQAGLELHTWMWTTNRGDEWIRENHPDWYMVSRTGKSCFDDPPYVQYYRWVSPVIPGVQEYLKERVNELASHPLVDGVHYDYVRYPDVILPTALWKDYGVDQTEELPEFDFCYSEHTRTAFREATGRDPIEIENPASDQEWLKFRFDSVTKLVRALTSVVHEHKKLATAAVFPTPSIARKVCRQDWDKWPLDAVFPMAYHSFYEAQMEWIGDCIREDIQAVSHPVYAGLYMPDLADPTDFRRALDISMRRGAKGASLFGDVTEECWRELERFLETGQPLS